MSSIYCALSQLFVSEHVLTAIYFSESPLVLIWKHADEGIYHLPYEFVLNSTPKFLKVGFLPNLSFSGFSSHLLFLVKPFSIRLKSSLVCGISPLWHLHSKITLPHSFHTLNRLSSLRVSNAFLLVFKWFAWLFTAPSQTFQRGLKNKDSRSVCILPVLVSSKPVAKSSSILGLLYVQGLLSLVWLWSQRGAGTSRLIDCPIWFHNFCSCCFLRSSFPLSSYCLCFFCLNTGKFLCCIQVCFIWECPANHAVQIIVYVKPVVF